MIVQEGDPSGSREHLLEQLQPFPVKLGGQRNHTRDISAWSGQVCDESQHHQVTARRRDDRDRTRRLLGREGGFASGCHHDVDLDIDQLGGQTRQSSHLSVSPPRLEDNVLAFYVP